jgi:hypothetical protein
VGGCIVHSTCTWSLCKEVYIRVLPGDVPERDTAVLSVIALHGQTSGDVMNAHPSL